MASTGSSIAICLAALIVIAASECLNGWIRFDDSCYRIYEKKLKWPDAQFECEKDDAFLAMIETKKESDNVHALVKELNIGVNDNIWIGLADVRQENVWVWENNKKNATFFDWGNNEPNQKGTTQQDCIMLYGKVGHKWADVQCDSAYFFLCERPLSAVIIG